MDHVEFDFICKTVKDTQHLAAVLGASLNGGEVIELSSDLGGGKTTFVKGLAHGMGVDGVVQSPSFTLSFVHPARNGRELHHFDFYRLDDPGVMAEELKESMAQKNVVIAIEWGDIVHRILPADRISIKITANPDDETRKIRIRVPDLKAAVCKALQSYR